MKKYKKHLLILLGLIIINLAFFSFNLNDFFVADDFDWLHLTKQTESIWQKFTANYYGVRGEGGSFRPMVNLSFWLNYRLFGLNPVSYHLTNLIFHIATCFLVYLLALTLLAKFKDKQKIALLASLFFAILPNHTEAVVWIGAIGDPLASFFYLLAFYLYILFRKRLSFTCLLVSALVFILGLLTKEFVITLPLLIVVWELYEALVKQKFNLNDILFKPLGYWAILVLYFLIRYLVIGVAFGYYAADKFYINFVGIKDMLISLIIDLVLYGQYRLAVTSFFTHNWNWLLFLAILITLAVLIWWVFGKYKFKAYFCIDAYLICILPVLFLSFSIFNDEGERFNYLPSVFFCLFLALLIWRLAKIKWLFNFVLVVILIYFGWFLIQKNQTWQVAADLSKQIVLQDIPNVIDLKRQNQRLLFVALPDNYEGAQVMRNGLTQAIELYYPDFKFKATRAYALLMLNEEIINEKVLYWGSYVTGGYLAQTFDHSYLVTGFDTEYTDEYTLELWGYDYLRGTSAKIRLIPQTEFDRIIMFNQGHLQILE